MPTRRQIPNLLTFARIAAVPIGLAIILLNPPCQHTALLWIFMAASLTDFLDGYLARKWGAVSSLGAMLDPIADKLLVALMLVYLLMVMGTPLMLPVMLILLRELYISGVREFLSAKQIALPVSAAGKWKTALQMLAIIVLLATNRMADTPETTYIVVLGCMLLYMAAAMAVVSAIRYTQKALAA